MIRTSLLVASSILVLSACQPASEAPQDTIVADTPPIAAETGADAAEAGATAAGDMVETAAADEAESTDAHEDENQDHEEHDDDHDDAEEHDHDEHDHEDAEEHDEEHDHEDEHEDAGHDEDEHDHAGGEAHVHGLSDLAVSLDGSTVSISVEGALANFDLDESIRTLDDAAPYTDGVVTLIGGDCTRDQASASIRPIGDHGNLLIDMVYSCAAIDAFEAVDVTGFATFAGFEEVNAVLLTETGQTAKTLTANESRLDIR